MRGLSIIFLLLICIGCSNPNLGYELRKQGNHAKAAEAFENSVDYWIKSTDSLNKYLAEKGEDPFPHISAVRACMHAAQEYSIVNNYDKADQLYVRAYTIDPYAMFTYGKYYQKRDADQERAFIKFHRDTGGRKVFEWVNKFLSYPNLLDWFITEYRSSDIKCSTEETSQINKIHYLFVKNPISIVNYSNQLIQERQSNEAIRVLEDAIAQDQKFKPGKNFGFAQSRYFTLLASAYDMTHETSKAERARKEFNLSEELNSIANTTINNGGSRVRVLERISEFYKGKKNLQVALNYLDWASAEADWNVRVARDKAQRDSSAAAEAEARAADAAEERRRKQEDYDSIMSALQSVKKQ